MTKRSRKGIGGRPRHTDDPPKQFATTLPESVHALIDGLTNEGQRTKSEVVTIAVKALWRREHASKT
jgi:hypothetical protein